MFVRHHRSLRVPCVISIFLPGWALPAIGQQQPAVVIAKTADNAATGATGRWDFGATDLTFKNEKKEIWLVDAYSSTDSSATVSKFPADNLASNPTKVIINLPPELAGAPVLGIAEIPHGDFKGKNLVLVDPTFGTQDAAQPQIGIYEDDGNLAAGEFFLPLDNLGDNVRLTSIEVNPVREEIAAYDVEHHAILILDFTYALLQGPIPVEGFSSQFAGPWFFGAVNRTGLRGSGVGLTYTSPDRVLLTSSFKNSAESHWALEYDLTKGGAYSSRAIDLSAAGSAGHDTALIGCAIGTAGNDAALFAYNVGDDSIYAFSITLEPHSPPVGVPTCAMEAATGSYTLAWSAPTDAASFDAIAIIENGATVATLAPTETTFVSPLPSLGKVFLEVATQKNGLTSGLRVLCETQNTAKPPLVGVQGDGVLITDLGVLSGVAVDKRPATPEDFRGYVISQLSNDIRVFDFTLKVLEKLVLDPRVVTAQGSTNVSAVGVALVDLDGEQVIAVLDPDGPADSGVPSAGFYSLAPDTRGTRIKEIDPIDLGALSPVPSLFDWDVGPDNNFVAGGFLPGTEDFVVVRILFDGDTLVASQMTLMPHRSLTPFVTAPLTGIGVSVLPSGNLLVAGSDTFSKTYTEALLMSPFVDAAPGREAAPAKFVGYSQGLRVLNQFFGLGPGVGPGTIFGLDTAYFAPPTDPPPPEGTKGVGVTYLPTGNIDIIQNPSTNQVLRQQGLLLIHSTNDCSHPDLVAEQLTDAAVDVGPSEKLAGTDFTPSFAQDASLIDYFLYVINNSETETASLTLEVKLGGTLVPETSHKVSLPPGRSFRRWLRDRSEDSLSVSVTNDGATAAKVRILTGAMGIGKGTTGQKLFRRGDCDANGVLNLTDAIVGLNWLFKGAAEPSCIDTADTDDDGKVSLTDMVLIVNFLFKGGPAPAPPGPEVCGTDPTDDENIACSYPCP